MSNFEDLFEVHIFEYEWEKICQKAAIWLNKFVYLFVSFGIIMNFCNEMVGQSCVYEINVLNYIFPDYNLASLVR